MIYYIAYINEVKNSIIDNFSVNLIYINYYFHAKY